MKEIIQKAIDGGYENDWKENANIQLYSGNVLSANVEKCILDPLFWQALSKACGWKENCVHAYDDKGKYVLMPEWKHYALRFHEINLTEGWDKAVSYLQEIIKS